MTIYYTIFLISAIIAISIKKQLPIKPASKKGNLAPEDNPWRAEGGYKLVTNQEYLDYGSFFSPVGDLDRIDRSIDSLDTISAPQLPGRHELETVEANPIYLSNTPVALVSRILMPDYHNKLFTKSSFVKEKDAFIKLTKTKSVSAYTDGREEEELLLSTMRSGSKLFAKTYLTENQNYPIQAPLDKTDPYEPVAREDQIGKPFSYFLNEVSNRRIQKRIYDNSLYIKRNYISQNETLGRTELSSFLKTYFQWTTTDANILFDTYRINSTFTSLNWESWTTICLSGAELPDDGVLIEYIGTRSLLSTREPIIPIGFWSSYKSCPILSVDKSKVTRSVNTGVLTVHISPSFGLQGIGFSCTGVGSNQVNIDMPSSSKRPIGDTRGINLHCPKDQPIVGLNFEAQVKSYPNGLWNIEAICADNSSQKTDVIHPTHNKAMTWMSYPLRCPPGEYICGLNARLMRGDKAHLGSPLYAPKANIMTDAFGIGDLKLGCC